MDEALFSRIILESEERKKEARSYTHRRYLYDQIRSVPKGYFVGVSGLRGIGKTVLLLQLAGETEPSLYISADATYLRQEGIYDLVRYAYSKGYSAVFIDEIHYKERWQQDLKTIYDEGKVRIFFSGSSALEIKKGADLSRRALLFHLKPLSFREYLILKKDAGPLDPIAAPDLFDAEKLKSHILRYAKFSDLLHEHFERGGLFYPSGDLSYFYKALENTVEKIIHSDLEHLREIDIKLENDIYKLLERIAISPVGETNYSTLANILLVSKPTLIRIVDDLVKIGLIRRILPCEKAAVRKEPKLYLAFPFRKFFCALLLQKADIGSLREEFFVNHVESTCAIRGNRGERIPDFLWEGKKVEIGGEGKTFYQHPDFLIKEGIHIEARTIPLFLIGFLY